MFDELSLERRISGRAKAPVEVNFVREIRESDLALLGESRGSKPPAIAKIRDRHHALARCLAQGMRDGEASAVTGYDPSRISILKSDPTFRELVEHYRLVEDSLLADFTQRATNLTLSAMNEMHERLEDSPEEISTGQLLEISKVFADRIGHAPVQRSVAVTANVELGSRMAAARARLASVPKLEVIEGSCEQVRGNLPVQSLNTKTPEDLLLEDLAALSARPLDFVYWAFPWGEAGTDLENLSGPDLWQLKVLSDLQSGLISFDIAWRIAIRSGHGVGKSAFFAWLILWAISTREYTRGRVTANTKEQLMRVLWGELAKWHRLFIAKHLFVVTATAIFARQDEKEWRIDAIPWSEDNPEAFAGLHNFNKRLLYIFDEASAIVDSIWEVMEGATTDANTEIIWAVAGNPTRNTGRFRDCWDRFGSMWHTYEVDARTSVLSNKKQIEEWRNTWGEDSDFFRIRVRGEFPNASTTQLIPLASIRAAAVREVQSQYWEPLILAVDVARFGNNESVAVFRRGRDARTMPAARWRGLSVVETGNRIAAMIVEKKPDACFIDEGGVGGGVVDYVRHLGHTCIGVNFGSTPGSRPGGTLVANKRAEMYVAMRDWLLGGCIDPSEDLASQLVSIEYHYTKKTEIILVSKEDMRSIGKDSPDWADALAMTFAFPVAARSWSPLHAIAKQDYDPFATVTGVAA